MDSISCTLEANDSSIQNENITKKSLDGKFLATDQVLNVLVNENVSRTEIPRSVIESEYFV